MSDTRDTLRVFYAPKEKSMTPARSYEHALEVRVAELERETAELTRRLRDREQELLDALYRLEELENEVPS